MANSVFCSYYFKGEDAPKFKAKLIEFEKEDPKFDMENLFKFFGVNTELQRCYIEDWDVNTLYIGTWDAWYPHTEIWDDILNLYDDLWYNLYAEDGDNYTAGFVNTGDTGTRYRLLWADDEEDSPTLEYFDTLEDAKNFLEHYGPKLYLIQKAWEEVEMFDEPNEIVEQTPGALEAFGFEL